MSLAVELTPGSGSAGASLDQEGEEYAASNTVQLRPEGMRDEQDLIIQHVAEYVVSSCNSAAYYQKLRQRTQHNVNFNFLLPSHPYYPYYAFLVESYQHWKRTPFGDAADACGMPVSNTLEMGTAYDMAGQHDTFYGGEYASGGASSAVRVAPTTAGVTEENAGGTDRLPPPQSTGMPSEKDAPTVAITSTPLGEAPLMALAMNKDEDEDEDEDEYELVEVNGVKQLVPRH